MPLTKVTYSMIDGELNSVVDFGADPTGVADSTTAFQSALNAGSVYIPDGTYIVSKVTITANNQKIIGQSPKAVVKRKDSTYGAVFENDGFDNVVFADFSVDGNKTGAPFVVATEYDIPGGGTLPSDERGDIVCLNASGNRVKSVYFTDSQTSPVLFYNMAFSQVVGCQSTGHNREGFTIRGGNDCVIDSCVSLGGSPLPYSLISTSGISGDTQKHNHSITNNYCYDSQAAFVTVNTTFTFVYGNTIGKLLGLASTGPGIRLGQGVGIPSSVTSGSIALGNKIDGIDDVGSGGTGRGISVDYAGDGVTVQDNIISNCTTGIGVSVSQNQNVKLVSNYVQDVTLGIDLFNAIGCDLTNNIIKNCDTGLSITAEDCFVADNYVFNASVKAYVVSAASGLNNNNTFKSNRSSGADYTNWSVTSPQSHQYINNEYGANQNSIITISGATPSVAAGNVFRVNNAVATNMTALADWKEGAIYLLRFDNGNTTLLQSGSFRMDGGVDVTPSAGNSMQFIAIASLFYEISRSF